MRNFTLTFVMVTALLAGCTSAPYYQQGNYPTTDYYGRRLFGGMYTGMGNVANSAIASGTNTLSQEVGSKINSEVTNAVRGWFE